ECRPTESGFRQSRWERENHGLCSEVLNLGRKSQNQTSESPYAADHECLGNIRSVLLLERPDCARAWPSFPPNSRFWERIRCSRRSRWVAGCPAHATSAQKAVP